jgi:hypothetical protein
LKKNVDEYKNSGCSEAACFIAADRDKGHTEGNESDRDVAGEQDAHRSDSALLPFIYTCTHVI